MRVEFNISGSELSKFEGACEAALRNVGRGTKKATIEACEDILEDSLKQVPVDTFTLSSSAFYEVKVRDDIKSHVFKGVVGYGGDGDPINPKTGQPASQYMVAVHEDLTAFHPNGKAKFLEDPVRDYARTRFSRNVIKHIQSALSYLTGGK